MNIVIVDPDRDLMSIDGFEFFGWVVDNAVCNVCGHKIIFSESLDAKFCPQCNEWREPPCSDSECMFCRSRSNSPLPRK